MPGTNAMVLEKVALSLRYKAVCPLAALLLQKQLFAQQSHHRVQRQNDRRAALSGIVGPMALRLQAKMGTRFLKRHLDLPVLGNQLSIRTGVVFWSGHRNAWVSSSYRGSRAINQRNCTTGLPPWYHKAVPVATSNLHFPAHQPLV